ncbi:MAG: TIGR02679 family protein [Solirubrobacteraceae bacterium]
MGDIDRERLTRLLGDPALAWLVDRARRRLELGRSLSGTVTLAGASTGQRRAAERLLGRRPRPGRGLTVSLDEVDAVLRQAGLGTDGLEAAVVLLTGPLTRRADVASREQVAWEEAFAGLLRGAARRAELTGWLERLTRSGVVKRLEPDPTRARALLDRLGVVLASLPAAGEPLGGFAARLLGEAHALDDGRPLATLAVGAARALAGLGAPAPGESPAESRRETWAAVGLLCDELSSVVLTVGLRGDEETGCGRILAAGRSVGQPLWLTLRQLVRDPPLWAESSAGAPVHICENPVIVALAADHLGADCPPLVCTNGQPRAATMLLLRSLAASGAALLHHGDYDWGGLHIANLLHARLPVTPWLFDSESYLRAVSVPRPASPLTGSPVAARWDPLLAGAMARAGRRIEEELVADELVAALARAAGRSPGVADVPAVGPGSAGAAPPARAPCGNPVIATGAA